MAIVICTVIVIGIALTFLPGWFPTFLLLIARLLPVRNPRAKLILSLLETEGWAEGKWPWGGIRHPHGVEIETSDGFMTKGARVIVNGSAVKLPMLDRHRVFYAVRQLKRDGVRSAEDRALADLARKIIEAESKVVPIRRGAA